MTTKTTEKNQAIAGAKRAKSLQVALKAMNGHVKTMIEAKLIDEDDTVTNNIS